MNSYSLSKINSKFKTMNIVQQNESLKKKLCCCNNEKEALEAKLTSITASSTACNSGTALSVEDFTDVPVDTTLTVNVTFSVGGDTFTLVSQEFIAETVIADILAGLNGAASLVFSESIDNKLQIDSTIPGISCTLEVELQYTPV